MSDAEEIKDGMWPSLRWERDTDIDHVTATFEHILERSAEGLSLRKICKAKGWPYTYVARWIANDPQRNEALENVFKIRAEDLHEESLEIADEAKGAKDGTGVASAKLRVDTRMKLAQRWNRAKYGEQPNLQINAQGGSLISILQGLPPVVAPEERVIEASAED